MAGNPYFTFRTVNILDTCLAKVGIFQTSKYDWNTGQEKEKVAAEDILSRFNEYAYNANSFYLTGRDMGEFAVSRRLEVLVSDRKIKNYCCKNAWKCENDDDEDTKDETYNRLNLETPRTK